MDDSLRRRVLWGIPTGLYLLGSRDGEEANLMTASLLIQVALEPKLVGVAVENSSVTCRLIRSGGIFAASYLRRDQREIVRRFVKPATVEGTTIGGYETVTSVTGAPILADAPAWLDCRVVESLEFGSHTLFVGEVVDVAGPPQGETVEYLRMEDTRMHYGG